MKKDNVERLLTDIKKLLILGLIKNGTQSKDIAGVLGVDPAVVTRLVPSKKIKKNGLEK